MKRFQSTLVRRYQVTQRHGKIDRLKLLNGSTINSSDYRREGKRIKPRFEQVALRLCSFATLSITNIIVNLTGIPSVPFG